MKYIIRSAISTFPIRKDFLMNHLKRYCTEPVRWTLPMGHNTNIMIYNPVTKEKVPLITKSSEYLSWYICGPTVYDYAHIGHACTYLRFDIIRRILERYTNMTVIQVMNITDIDDKIIALSKEKNTNFKAISRFYERDFFEDLTSLGIKKPTVVARVTDFIPQIIRFIEMLLQRNVAYVGSDGKGSVYFSIEKYGKHGKLVRTQIIENTNSYESVTKRDVFDFALWKLKTDDPLWQSPWGLGRPGWHIECSVIASEYFGSHIDLHSGGIDLKFPHHENEESQSCAFHGVDQWVNYYFHAGHLINKNDKMSKSLKNTISVKDYLSSNSPNYLRMLCLYTNYRSSIDFDSEEIINSIKMCTRFFQFFDVCRTYFHSGSNYGNIDSNALLKQLEETKQKVDQHLTDDFDTKACIYCFHELILSTNLMLNEKLGNRCVISVSLVYTYLKNMTEFFGLEFSEKTITSNQEHRSADIIEDVLNSSVNFRSNVRNLALSLEDPQNKVIRNDLLTYSDELRKQLNYCGISVKDYKNDFSTWSYVVTSSKKFKKKVLKENVNEMCLNEQEKKT